VTSGVSQLTSSPRPQGWEDSLTGRFLADLFAAYENECVRYVAVRNFTSWPQDFGQDIDLVVHPNDLQLSHRIIRRVAPVHGLRWSLRQAWSSHLHYDLLPARVAAGETGFLLDLRPDLVHRGFIYLPGTLLLESRRREGKFYAPSPALESLGILLHCVLDNSTVRPIYRERLRELASGRDDEFQRVATVIVGSALAERLAACLAVNEPERALALRRQIFIACARRNPRALSRWMSARVGSKLDHLRAWVRPPGKVAILVGPDGAGKTTLSELLPDRFAHTRIPVRSAYLGAQQPILPTRHLSRWYRKRFSTPGKAKPPKDAGQRWGLRGLVHVLLDQALRYLVHVRPRLVRGEIVLLDRYLYDWRTFPHPLVRRPRVEQIAMRLIPKPGLVFCLVADPALIAARKKELSPAETARQIASYRGLRRWVRNFHEVPADGDLPSVVDGMTETLLQLYEIGRTPETI
jgi:thymidylate kinase